MDNVYVLEYVSPRSERYELATLDELTTRCDAETLKRIQAVPLGDATYDVSLKYRPTVPTHEQLEILGRVIHATEAQIQNARDFGIKLEVLPSKE